MKPTTASASVAPAATDTKKNPSDGFGDLVALLEALRISHESSHWTAAKGQGFYSTHLLFERLYAGIPAEVDALAEKIVSLFGDKVVAGDVLAPKIGNWITRWHTFSTDPLARALAAEQELQRALRSLANKCEVAWLGLDNHLRSIADDHDTAVYLLQRAIG